MPKQRKGRMLRENCLESKKLARATHAACNLWFRLLVKVDDFGNFLDEPAVIKTACFLWRPGFRNNDVKRLIDELQQVGLLSRYEMNGERFIHLERFEDFQELRYERVATFPRLIAPPDAVLPQAAPPACGQNALAAAGCPPTPPAKPSADNKNDHEVKKKRREAAAATAGNSVWEEIGVHPRPLPPEFRELCEGLYATRNGQPMSEFVGVCMDVWESRGNKIPPRFARAAAEIREREKSAPPPRKELVYLEDEEWLKSKS